MKKIIWISFTLSLNLLTSCAIKPPDIPVCVEMSLDRGECIKVISGEKITIDEKNKYQNKTWWESRPTNIIMPLSSWVDLKKWIIDMCRKNKNVCDKEISSWDRSLEIIDQKVKQK